MADSLIKLIGSCVICLFAGISFIGMARNLNSGTVQHSMLLVFGAIFVVVGFLLFFFTGLTIRSMFSK
jgi:protein-S-isoprenylcysteine O-methyltransferase Ste14